MHSKTFKTLDEQVEILQSKGLIIDDVEYVRNILLRENYFFISGYRHLFLKSAREKLYITGTNFRELYAMFYFDRQVRNIIFKNILIVENNMKSIFSYQLSKKYGYQEKNYLNEANFNNTAEKKRQLNDLLKKMKRQIRVNGGQHTATMHYLNSYGYIPMWVVVKVLSFGIVSELYTVMKPVDQDEIAEIFKIEKNSLLNYLPILANYRNLCAHEDILYDNRTQRVITDTKYHYKLNVPLMDGEYIYGKNDLFALVIILKQILDQENFTLLINELTYEIELLSGKLKSITIDKVLDKMGLPENYKEIMRVD